METMTRPASRPPKGNWRRCHPPARPVQESLGWSTCPGVSPVETPECGLAAPTTNTAPRAGTQLTRPPRGRAPAPRPSLEALWGRRGHWLSASAPLFCRVSESIKSSFLLNPDGQQWLPDLAPTLVTRCPEQGGGSRIPSSARRRLHLPPGDLGQVQVPPRPPAACRDSGSCVSTPPHPPTPGP